MKQSRLNKKGGSRLQNLTARLAPVSSRPARYLKNKYFAATTQLEEAASFVSDKFRMKVLRGLNHQL